MAEPLPRLATRKMPPATLAALCAWLLPGLGHWLIGQRARGVIFFVVLTATFWTGIAIGGVRTTIAGRENGAWIAAQLFMGPQALGAFFLSRKIQDNGDPVQYKAMWPASSIAIVYAGVAGLLNLLVIVDVLARIDAATSTVPARASPAKAKR